MTTQTTQAQAATTIPPTPTPTAEGAPKCWKRTQSGWTKVPAPWGDDIPSAWLIGQPTRLVFDVTSPERGGNLNNPWLRVFAIGGRNQSDAGECLIGEVSGVERNPAIHNPFNDWYFLCDWPALPGLVAEYEPLLKFHQ